MFALEEGFVAEWQPDEQQFRAILSGLNEALLIYEPNGKLRYLNAAALADEFRYLHPVALDPEKEGEYLLYTLDGETVPNDQLPLKRILRAETFTEVELRIIHKPSGKRYLHRCSAWLVSHEGPLCIIKAHDITERREAEERFTTCFSENPIPTILIALSDLCIIDANKSFLEITGFERDSVVAQRFTDLELFDDTKERENLLERFQRGETPERSTQEFKLRSKSGDVLNVIIQSQPISLHGEPALLGTLVDVTDRKRTEEQLMQAIQEVMKDTAWFSRSVMEKLAQIKTDSGDVLETVELTARERQVLELIARGYDNRQIGEELELAKTTVRNYVARLYSKINVHSRAEAVVWARERGIVATQS